MKWIATRKSEQNQAAIDPWTAVHLGAGLALGLMSVPLRRALPAAIAYEVAEQFLERKPWGRKLFHTSGPEVLSNAVVDVVVFAAGHWLAERWNATGPEEGAGDPTED